MTTCSINKKQLAWAELIVYYLLLLATFEGVTLNKYSSVTECTLKNVYTHCVVK